MGLQPNPYIVEGEAVAPQPGGRPTVGRPVLQRSGHKFSAKLFIEKLLPPGSGADGVYSCKFRKQKYIFVKNEIEKYKNKKSHYQQYCTTSSIQGSSPKHRREKQGKEEEQNLVAAVDRNEGRGRGGGTVENHLDR